MYSRLASMPQLQEDRAAASPKVHCKANGWVLTDQETRAAPAQRIMERSPFESEVQVATDRHLGGLPPPIDRLTIQAARLKVRQQRQKTPRSSCNQRFFSLFLQVPRYLLRRYLGHELV